MKKLLVLHGALGSKQQVQPLCDALRPHYKVSAIDFSGHGGRQAAGDFSISLFAREVSDWAKENHVDRLDILGYSMGGYVALYLASINPGLVASVVTLGTKFQWDANTAAKETAMLRPETMEAKVPAFARELAQRHQPSDWKDVVRKTADMMRRMGEAPPLNDDDFKAITAKVLLLLGDGDRMVTLEETTGVFRLLQSAQLGVLPNTPHPLEKVDPDLVRYLVHRFVN